MKSPLNNLSNLQQRIIAAIFGVAIILSAILYSEWTFILLFSAISVLTQLEFYKLLGLDGNQPLTYYGTMCGGFINIITFLIEKEVVDFQNYFLISPLVTMILFTWLFLFHF